MYIKLNTVPSKQKDAASTCSKRFGSITDSLSHFSSPEDTPISTGNDKVNSIIKKVSLSLKYERDKKKFKLKGEFSFSLVSTETITRIINDLDLKKSFPWKNSSFSF